MVKIFQETGDHDIASKQSKALFEGQIYCQFFQTFSTKCSRFWGKLDKVKFLCPAPGYDRHFAICEHFGIEMITVENKNNDIDVEKIEELVAADDSIKGIWVVPKYGNPTGTSVADSVVDKLASMKTAANDFRIFWDNAYTVHHLSEEQDVIKNLFVECKAQGNANRVFVFGSTSKITFAGSGMAAVGGSVDNMNWIKSHLSISTIGPDKINQVRHARFFGNFEGLQKHMVKHAELIKPKFDIREKHGISDNSKIILTVGRHHPKKNF